MRKRKQRHGHSCTTRTDYTLPDELWIQVFSVLDVTDKCQAARVCTRWNQLITTHSLWKSIDLIHTDINIREAWPHLRQRFSSTLTVLHIGHLHYREEETISSEILKDIGRLCVNLKDLTLMGLNLRRVKSDSLPSSLKLLNLTKCQIFRGWFHAAGVSQNLSGLVRLRMRYIQKGFYYGMHFLRDSQVFPNLLELSIINTPRQGPLCVTRRRLGLYAATDYFADNCPKLNRLELGDCLINDSCLKVISKKLTSLKHLHLRHCLAITMNDVATLTTMLSLETLHIIRCFKMDEELCAIFGNFKKQCDFKVTTFEND